MLIIVTACPIAAAWLLFFNPALLSDASSHHGGLIQPPRPVADITLQTPGGEAYSLADLRGSWTLVTVARGFCGASCEQNLDHFDQIRSAVGGDRKRVQRLLVLTHYTPDPRLPSLLSRYHGTVPGVGGEIDRFISRLPDDAGATLNRIYVVDPMGNLIMHYAQTVSPHDVLSDLKRLLKVSKHW